VIGGVGKKIMQGKMPRKKKSCKEEGKEKKIMQKKGPLPGPAILKLIVNKGN